MKVTINGKEHEVGSELTYEQIARLANQPTYATCVYHTKRKNGNQRSGLLYSGKKVTVEEGMTISIIVTGNA